MRLRPYRVEDLDSVLDVWERASRTAHSFLPESFFATERNLLASRFLPRSTTTVAEVDGRVVGFLSRRGHEVGGLFVDPDHQRQGVGRALVDAARRPGEPLELDVFEENATGRAFYAAYGFGVAGRHLDDEVGHHELRLLLPPSGPDSA